jgi:hypothetical protein
VKEIHLPLRNKDDMASVVEQAKTYRRALEWIYEKPVLLVVACSDCGAEVEIGDEDKIGPIVLYHLEYVCPGRP